MSYDAPPSPYGAPGPEQQGPTKEKNTLGVVALILGILAVFPFSILAGIPALILGIINRKAAKEGRATNGGFGLTGIILGAFSIAFFVLIILIAGLASDDDSGDVVGAPTASASAEEPTPETTAPVQTPEPVETPQATQEPEPTDEPEPTAEPTEEPGAAVEEEATVGLGEPVTAGDFEYTVEGVECGVDNIGGSDFGQDAQGQFCLVQMSVMNVGDSASTFFSQNVTMLNADDVQYSADDAAGIYVEGNDTFLSQINPGNTLEGTVVFDIPTDQQPAALEFAGGFFDDPVRVAL